MDIIIPDSWLRDYLKTSAKPDKIAECLSLCGPSVEKVEKAGSDWLYSIEVTTNRVDVASVYGIAREAAAILPRFGIKAALQPIKVNSKQQLKSEVGWLETTIDHKLCPRFTAILIRDVKVRKSPEWLMTRTDLVNVRPINNVVDISNYLMHELGQPVHTFDYDKIQDKKMVLRASRKGEKLTTLDGKTFELPGGDIVIEDGSGRLIDLAGIMGGENSAVSEKTKNVLLFVQTYNPATIRKTSMALAQRTEAAALFEKGLDPENVEVTIRHGIDLFGQLTGGKPENEILDLYPERYSVNSLSISLSFLKDRLGEEVKGKEVAALLGSLGFSHLNIEKDVITVHVPSWRAADVQIREDILEEVARLYGYQNLDSRIMTGTLPEPPQNTPFEFEDTIRNILKGYGGNEVYTYSFTSRAFADLNPNPSWVLKLKNPLGPDSEYMRLSLAPSLLRTVKENSGETDKFMIFEISNVYLPVRGDLPEEKMTLGIAFSKYMYEEAKGILEALVEELGIGPIYQIQDSQGFKKSQRLRILVGREEFGQFGVLTGGTIYLEVDMKLAQEVSHRLSAYKPLPKYPPQIEDLTFLWRPKTYLGDVIGSIMSADKQISKVELVSTYEDSRTFRVSYQNLSKTLTDAEVEGIRKKILKKLQEKYSLKLKS